MTCFYCGKALHGDFASIKNLKFCDGYCIEDYLNNMEIV